MVARRARAGAGRGSGITILLGSIALVGCAPPFRPSEQPIATGSPPNSSAATASAASAAANAWTEPAAYTFTLTSSCGERALIGTFRVTVEAHVTVAFVGVDAAGKGYQSDPRTVPTIGEILREADDAKVRNASRVEVTRDPLDGRPVEVTIDRLANAIDDESCYRIGDYVAGG
jgi:uncharacterized protein DUF6174